jgi:transcriptional regulator with XRE-family HTH domain
MMKHTSAPLDNTRFFVGLAAVTRASRARGELSQREVARRAGLGAKFISDIERERANPTMTRLDQLAKGLGLAGVAELVVLADETARRTAAATILPRSPRTKQSPSLGSRPPADAPVPPRTPAREFCKSEPTAAGSERRREHRRRERHDDEVVAVLEQLTTA